MVVNLLSHLILQNYIPLKVFYLQGGNKQWGYLKDGIEQ